MEAPFVGALHSSFGNRTSALPFASGYRLSCLCRGVRFEALATLSSLLQQKGPCFEGPLKSSFLVSF